MEIVNHVEFLWIAHIRDGSILSQRSYLTIYWERERDCRTEPKGRRWEWGNAKWHGIAESSRGLQSEDYIWQRSREACRHRCSGTWTLFVLSSNPTLMCVVFGHQKSMSGKKAMCCDRMCSIYWVCLKRMNKSLQ